MACEGQKKGWKCQDGFIKLKMAKHGFTWLEIAGLCLFWSFLRGQK